MVAAAAHAPIERAWFDAHDFLIAEFWVRALRPGRMRRMIFGPPHKYVVRPGAELRAAGLLEDCFELRIAMQLERDWPKLLEQWRALLQKDCLLHYIAIGELLGDEIEYGPLSCLCNLDDPWGVRCHARDPWGRPWPVPA